MDWIAGVQIHLQWYKNMAITQTSSELNSPQRMEIPYFDGLNSLAASNISKKQEFSYSLNARSVKVGSIEKRGGTVPFGSLLAGTGNYGLFYFDAATVTNSNNTGLYRVTTVAGVTDLYYLHVSGTWTRLSDTKTKATLNVSYTFAEECCFLVNGHDDNEYIYKDGNNRAEQGHLEGSPKAHLINFYKERLYVGNYATESGSFIPTGVAWSSRPLGLLGLVDGDFASGETTIDMTDTTYIRPTETVQVYRAGELIGTLSITDKTEDTITASHSFGLLASDQLWVYGSFADNEKKRFRWTTSISAGNDAEKKHTMKLSGADNDDLTASVNIGDIMVIANKTNIAFWNNYNQQNLDLGIGIVSPRGYIKNIGTLFFMDYSGVYSTSGAAPQLISNKVEDYILGANKGSLQACVAGKKGYSIFFSIGDVTLKHPDGSEKEVIENVVLEYNMRQQTWFVHDNSVVDDFCTYRDNSKTERILYSGDDGDHFVYEYLEGSTDIINGDEKEILFRVDTDHITLSSYFEKICYPQEVIIETERGNGMETFISLDTDSFYKIEGESSKGSAILKVTSRSGTSDDIPRCRRLKVSLRDYSRSLCKITRMAFIYTQTLEEEEMRADKYGD